MTPKAVMPGTLTMSSLYVIYNYYILPEQSTQQYVNHLTPKQRSFI